MRILVHYPRPDGRLVLRTDDDWEVDIAAASVTQDGDVHEFQVESSPAYFYFKPVLLRDGEEHWARGNDYLALQHASGEREIWPYFLADQSCSTCDMRELADPATDTEYQFRVFQPPGYAENTLKRYPVLYLQDGQNMFFRNGGSGGHDWRLEETLTRLADMNAVDKVLAVGVYAANRGRDYSLPGCEAYARFLAHVLKPHIDREFRTLPGPRDTAIMGASLGGVATFYTAWTWPDVFGKAACLSTSFGWRDDLSERVAREAKRDALFYLDSGWPKDNFETTRDMRALLASRGWSEGHDLFYFAFPVAHHDEHSWAMRCHIPIQIMFGRRPSPGPAHREPPTDCSGG